MKQQRYLLLLVAPALVVTFVFFYLPLSGWVIAFTDYQIGSRVFGGEFIGLKQFRRFFVESADFWYLIRNTLVMNGASIAQNIVVALFFAILLKELASNAVARTVQTVAFFPFFVSWVITYSIVWSLLSVNSGAVNQWLVSIGVIDKGINVLGDAKYSWPLIIYLNLWKFTGYNTIIFMASMSGIPQEQYEAAEMDGAGRLGKMFYITIPNLIPTATVLLVLNSGWILNSNLEQFFIFTNATNWERMEVLDMYVYKFGLGLGDYSYATAVGMLKTVVSLLIISGANWVAKRINGYPVF